MNKKHWNTIVADGSVADKQLKEWIDHSYDLVVSNPDSYRDAKEKVKEIIFKFIL